VSEIWIASDWHLAPGSPAAHGRLALAFLESARAAGARVILNGDVFDELFAGRGRGEAAHPEVVRAMEALSAERRLARTRGNHDPDAGEERVEVEWPGVGRVLVAHGHLADPVNASPVGRLGDAISRRFGRSGLVRGAAWLVETAARAVAEDFMIATFRRRCLALVERGGFALGVFGHVHEAHLVPGDRYANAGSLAGAVLEYLALGDSGPRLEVVREIVRAGRGGT
jgi:UDP-2,3-diacylglucosamine pyrophosphatase LpxH